MLPFLLIPAAVGLAAAVFSAKKSHDNRNSELEVLGGSITYFNDPLLSVMHIRQETNYYHPEDRECTHEERQGLLAILQKRLRAWEVTVDRGVDTANYPVGWRNWEITSDSEDKTIVMTMIIPKAHCVQVALRAHHLPKDNCLKIVDLTAIANAVHADMRAHFPPVISFEIADQTGMDI